MTWYSWTPEPEEQKQQQQQQHSDTEAWHHYHMPVDFSGSKRLSSMPSVSSSRINDHITLLHPTFIQDGAPDCGGPTAAALDSCQAVGGQLDVCCMVEGVPLHICQLARDAIQQEVIGANE
jgi:hypothetical protein